MTGVIMSKGRDTRGVHAQRKGHARTQQEGGHMQAKERGLRRNLSFQHLDLGFLASRIVSKYISVV